MFRVLFNFPRKLFKIPDVHLGYSSYRVLVHTDAHTDAEKKLAETLANKIDANSIKVRDISGGCGAMYEIDIESEAFRGRRTVQQHRMVNEALAEEVKAMHGLRINTSIPSSS